MHSSNHITRTIGIILCLLFFSSVTWAKVPQVRVFGYVLDSDNRGIELANVYVEGSTNGTTTNQIWIKGYIPVKPSKVNLRPEYGLEICILENDSDRARYRYPSGIKIWQGQQENIV
jgi:hypothetical protein